MRRLTYLVAAAAVAGSLALIPLATASPSAAPARAAAITPQAIAGASTTWGGYAANAPKGTTVAQVNATFTVPTAKPSGSIGPAPFQAVMWAGMDGMDRTDSPGDYPGVEQAGVWASASSRTSQPSYWLFWEMAPANSRWDFTASNGKTVSVIHVKPGNTISVIVAAPGETEPFFDNQFHMIVGVTSASGTAYYRAHAPIAKGAAGARHTAEVITELPTPNKGKPAIGALDTTPVHYTYVAMLLRNPKDAVPEPYQLTRIPMVMTHLWWQGIARIVPSKPFKAGPSDSWPDAFNTTFTGQLFFRLA